MKSWKIIALFGCMILLARLGIQSTIAVVAAAVVIEFGPDRLKSLPYAVRESAAAQLLVILSASVACVGASFLSLIALSQTHAMLFGLASWLCIAVVGLVSVFHVISYPVNRRRTIKRTVHFETIELYDRHGFRKVG